MTIKYFVNDLNHILRNCVLGMYVARLKKHIYIAFDRALMSLGNIVEIIQLIRSEKYGDWSILQRVNFPQLIHSICWRYDYFKKRCPVTIKKYYIRC